jgi:hypothetical protein
MEASRRIELLYTDLQSLRFPNEINAVGTKKYQDKARTAGEPDTPYFSDLPKENAANLAGPNGAKLNKKQHISCDEDTPSWLSFASEFPKLASVYGDDLQERVQRAFDALSDLDPWQAEKVAAKVLSAAGSPLPSFLGGMDDARFWASLASPSEAEAYGAACFEVMDSARLPDFLSFMQGRAVA